MRFPTNPRWKRVSCSNNCCGAADVRTVEMMITGRSSPWNCSHDPTDVHQYLSDLSDLSPHTDTMMIYCKKSLFWHGFRATFRRKKSQFPKGRLEFGQSPPSRDSESEIHRVVLVSWEQSIGQTLPFEMIPNPPRQIRSRLSIAVQ